jgi:hypothetical protein
MVAVTANLEDLLACDVRNEPAMGHTDPTIRALRFDKLNRHGFLHPLSVLPQVMSAQTKYHPVRASGQASAEVIARALKLSKSGHNAARSELVRVRTSR